MIAPMIGPSNVPRPPTSTMKIIFADQLTPKIESGPSGGIDSCHARITVPAAVQPAPASTKSTPFPSNTRTPTDAAAASSSRIA